jgi:F0F1-type ATP synthase membrane subunit b/b'|tara:strand:- start:1239 stop:1391 length:153 start_codon:yes stop_codon:yes gene_type:complete
VSNNQSDQASQQAQNIIEDLRNENKNLFAAKEEKEDELHQMKEQLQAKDH